MDDGLPITVNKNLFDAVKAAMHEDFAVSYLCGATNTGSVLNPRTNYAREKLLKTGAARRAIEGLGFSIGPAIDPARRASIKAIEDVKRREKIADGLPAKPWTPASEEEYRSMSLADKIREHRVLAWECAMRAGPMWLGGQDKNARPLTREEMPPKWFQEKEREANHMAEVKRLTEKMLKAVDEPFGHPDRPDSR